ncbi:MULTISPECIES: hypothetical protein [unclassified Pseudomonas]|uniref:hypothetical protein n=1 Tax=unclassified Pseudomonas TaxID=196821 RepID=UPI00190C7F11|nr:MULTISPECIES: hypothetical protein [unclassified Pseudomonas]MBK3468849.1 hypothetical protein [Pseudomonas sp. MF6776]
MSAVSQKKPTILELLQIFVIASALITAGTYLYTWSHDLAPQQEQIVKLIGAAIPIPFGLAVAYIWWAFQTPITAAVGKFSSSLVGIQRKAKAIFCNLINRFK